MKQNEQPEKMYCYEWTNEAGERISGVVAATSAEQAATRLAAMRSTAHLTGSTAADPLPTNNQN